MILPVLSIAALMAMIGPLSALVAGLTLFEKIKLVKLGVDSLNLIILSLKAKKESIKVKIQAIKAAKDAIPKVK